MNQESECGPYGTAVAPGLVNVGTTARDFGARWGNCILHSHEERRGNELMVTPTHRGGAAMNGAQWLGDWGGKQMWSRPLIAVGLR